MMSRADQPLVQTRKGEALAWLREHPEEAKTITASQVADRLGWNRSQYGAIYEAIREYRNVPKRVYQDAKDVRIRIEKWMAKNPGQLFNASEMAGFVGASVKTTQSVLIEIFGPAEKNRKRTAPLASDAALDSLRAKLNGGHPASPEELLGELIPGENAGMRATIVELRRQMRGLEDEIRRLKTEGTPGVMHEVDRAFYDLMIKERDYYKYMARSQINDDGSPRRPE